MIGTQMPDRVERAILEAFARVGYEESLVEHNVDHSFAGQRLDPVQMAAFWNKPPDQFTSALAVRWMADSESSIREIKTLGTQLWAPFGLIARPSHCELWDAFPPPPSKQPRIIEESIPYPDLNNKLKSYEHLLGREQVRLRKVQSRQFALYEHKRLIRRQARFARCLTRERTSGRIILTHYLVGASRDKRQKVVPHERQ